VIHPPCGPQLWSKCLVHGQVHAFQLLHLIVVNHPPGFISQRLEPEFLQELRITHGRPSSLKLGKVRAPLRGRVFQHMDIFLSNYVPRFRIHVASPCTQETWTLAPPPPHPTPKTSKKHGLLEAPIPKTWNTLLLYPACEHVSKQESDTVVNPCRPNNKPQWDVVEWIGMIFYHLVHYQLIIQYHLVSHPISFGLISSNIYWIYSSFWCHIFHIPHLDTSPEPWHSGTSPEHLAAEAASVAWASLTSVSSFPFPSTTGMIPLPGESHW